MHGVKRTKLSKEDEDRKKKEDAEQIASYKTMVDECLNRKDNRDYSEDAFHLTNGILDFNPEFYTIWNYRRLIMLEGLFSNAAPEERYSRLTSELRLTTSYLKIHPKVYWIWTHRKWCLEHIPDGPGRISSSAPVDEAQNVKGANGTVADQVERPVHPSESVEESTKPAQTDETPKEREEEEENDVEGWKKEAWGRELMLVEKMLEADSRNFHAWDYRRYVLSSLPRTFQPAKTPQTEVRYTTKKIESNFSNFSAWHQRTKELAKIWDSMRTQHGVEDGGAETEIQKMRQKESEKSTARQNMRQWLKDLERIDPFRRERYKELGDQMEKGAA
ncbi:hypothetical protein QFC21_000225 [Naganishia friedmannii]|uniref:Uncharacterized protein n=1 Tax=Naganishia friedmannii TaxID=89922 RepID=A0ACC2WCF0_9TREE|nr:hypothetical protein QFC21_000225 [Naganishia friedmannii]